METFRTVAIGVAGAIFASLLLGNLSEQNKSRREALDSFLSWRYQYTTGLWDFCQRNNWLDAREFKSKTFYEYWGSMMALEAYFNDEDINAKINDAVTEEDALYKMCQCQPSSSGKCGPSKPGWMNVRYQLTLTHDAIEKVAQYRLSRWWWPF